MAFNRSWGFFVYLLFFCCSLFQFISLNLFHCWLFALRDMCHNGISILLYIYFISVYNSFYKFHIFYVFTSHVVHANLSLSLISQTKWGKSFHLYWRLYLSMCGMGSVRKGPFSHNICRKRKNFPIISQHITHLGKFSCLLFLFAQRSLLHADIFYYNNLSKVWVHVFVVWCCQDW